MTGNVRDDLNIDPTDIDQEIIRLPGLYAWYNEQYQKKRREARKMKLALDVFEASLYQKFRDQFVARGQKPTETQIDAQVRQNPDWQRRKSDLIDLETEADQLDKVLFALYQKKEMLITYCANRRKEQSTSFAMKGPDGQQQYDFPPASPGGFPGAGD